MSGLTLRAELLRAYHDNEPAVTIELARRYLAGEPDDRAVLLIYGESLIDLARFGEAEPVIHRALALSQNDERTAPLRLIGRLHDAQGQLSEAAEFYRAAIDSSPGHASAYIYLGAMLARTGRLEEAEAQHLQATTCVEGDLSEAFLNLALVRRGRSDYYGALESGRAALAIDPDYAAAKALVADLERLLFNFPAPEA